VLTIVSESTGSGSSLEILGSSSAGLLADLGLSTGQVLGTAGESPAQVLAAVNAAIAGQGLAALAVATAIRITSNLAGPTADVTLGTGSTTALVAELGLKERNDGVYGNRQNRANLLSGGTLNLVVNGTAASVSFHGTTAAAVTGSTVLGSSIGASGSLDVSVNGNNFSVAVAATDTGAGLVAALNAQLGSTGIASLSGGALKIASRSTGATTSVSILGSSSGAVLAALGYSSGQSNAGLDGETPSQVEAAIQAAVGADATATASTSYRLGILSTVMGSGSVLRVLSATDSALVTELGFTLSSQSAGTDQELAITATHSNGDSSTVQIALDAASIRFAGALEGLILDKDPTLSAAADLSAVISYNEGGVSNVRRVQDALDALGELDGALDILTRQRSRVGSYSRRLDHALANLEESQESLQAALSRMRDADLAAVVTELNQHLTGRNAVLSMLTATGRLSRSLMEAILSTK
jgi:flagellin